MKIGAAGEPVIFDVNTFPHFHLCDSETREVEDYIDDGLMELLNRYFADHPIDGMKLERIDLNLIGHMDG